MENPSGKGVASRVLAAVVLLGVAVPVPAMAADRLIDDMLVYSDPTVAEPSKWVGGFSADLVYTRPNFTYTDYGGVIGTTYTLTEQYSQPGVSAWFGYGDVPVLAGYHGNTGTFGGTLTGTVTGGSTEHLTIHEYEIDLRWLVRPLSSRYFAPYVLVGYLVADEKDTFSATVTGVGGTLTLGPITSTLCDSVPLFGVGGIISVTEKFGVRTATAFGTVPAMGQPCSAAADTVSIAIPQLRRLFGAGEGNRTLVCSLGSCRSTIELHPLGREFYFRVSTVVDQTVSDCGAAPGPVAFAVFHRLTGKPTREKGNGSGAVSCRNYGNLLGS